MVGNYAKFVISSGMLGEAYLPSIKIQKYY